MSFGTIHKGSTGLLAFSRGLDSLSNNIANLNTPGFKRSDILFRDLFYQYQLTGDSGRQTTTSQLGNGVTTAGTLISFAQGDLQETGRETDAAINGNGFFILQDGENTYYTRAGQFEFDENGYLISSALDARVMAIDASGRLTEINITNLRNSQPQATTSASFVGNLSTGDTDHDVTVSVIDTLGESHDLTVSFTNNSAVTAGSWLIDVEDESSNSLATGLEIRFDGSGLPVAGFNTVNFAFDPSGAALATTITLDFGQPGSGVGATSLSGGANSTLVLDEQNGIVSGSLLDFRFQNDGTLELRYTNEQTVDVGRLALGWFDQLQSLRQIGNGLFLAPDDIRVTIGAAGEGIMGGIVGGSVEISNVELTQEFTELIIVQRGYQAASQVITVANEMIQQLLDAGKGR